MALSRTHLLHPNPVLRFIPDFQVSRQSRLSFTRNRLRHASSNAPVTDKSRILEKPTRFNPPSHPSRRVRPRSFPGPRLSEQERVEQQTKRYPNMMPPEGTFMHSFLTDRRVHLFITLGTLFFLAAYSLSQSFLHTTIYRDQLPEPKSLLSHPFRTISEFLNVYKLHVAYESEQVAQKRRVKLEDAAKRKEFMKEHGVEPGFLTGSWMEKFGTIEGDRWRAEREGRRLEEDDERQSPINRELDESMALAAGDAGAQLPGSDTGDTASQSNSPENQAARREKKKVKMWFGIWWRTR